MDWEVSRKKIVWFSGERGKDGCYVSDISLAGATQGMIHMDGASALKVGENYTRIEDYSSCWVCFYNAPPGSIFTLDLHLDCSGPWVSSRLKCLHCILQLESMCYELLHVDDTALHESDSSRPGIAVSVLKL